MISQELLGVVREARHLASVYPHSRLRRHTLIRLLTALVAGLGLAALTATNSISALAWSPTGPPSFVCIPGSNLYQGSVTVASGKQTLVATGTGAPGSMVTLRDKLGESFGPYKAPSTPCLAPKPTQPPPVPPPVVVPPPPVTHPIDHKPPPPVGCVPEDEPQGKGDNTPPGKEGNPSDDVPCVKPPPVVVPPIEHKPPKHEDCATGYHHPQGDEEHCVPDVKPTPTPKQTPPPVASHPRENLPPPPVNHPQPPVAKVAPPAAPVAAAPAANVPGPPVTGSGPDSYHLVKPAALADTAATDWPKLALLTALPLLAIGGLIVWMTRRRKEVAQN